MSTTFQYAGITITRKIGPARLTDKGGLVALDGGDPRLVEIFVGDGAEIAVLTPAQANEVGWQLVAAAGLPAPLPGWKGE